MTGTGRPGRPCRRGKIDEMVIELEPIGHVHGGRIEAVDDDWDREVCEIRLDPDRFTPDALAGLDAFSHIEVVFQFDQVTESEIVLAARRPRGRAEWPMVGIFAQRGKMRPNRLGLTTCSLISVEGLTVSARGLDAIDGTPVLDIKPHMVGFIARGDVVEPAWATELMADYW